MEGKCFPNHRYWWSVTDQFRDWPVAPTHTSSVGSNVALGERSTITYHGPISCLDSVT